MKNNIVVFHLENVRVLPPTPPRYRNVKLFKRHQVERGAKLVFDMGTQVLNQIGCRRSD